MPATVLEGAIDARISKNLADRIGPTKFSLWFNQSARLGVEAGALRVTVPSRFHADWITRNFRDDLKASATKTTGQDLEIELEVRPDAFQPATTPPGIGESSTDLSALEPPVRHTRRLSAAARSSFDERYAISRFVRGQGNELAFQAASRMAEGDESFNPLFIHGGCGLGKTHLLQGICRRFRTVQPGARIRYATGEQFTNEYITAVRSNKLDRFRREIRRLDLLALDDVHFLSNKHATQNEFLCTFDAIGMTGARVVLASDEHPRRIQQFHRRLVSRFLSGMVVEVHLPDRDLRLKLIQHIAKRRGLSLQQAAAEVLADRCVGSVREIEGLMTRLQAAATLLRDGGTTSNNGNSNGSGLCEIGMIAVDQALGTSDMTYRRPIRVSRIVETVAERFGVDESDIFSHGRHRHVVMARSVAAFMARKLTTLSFPEIARAMSRTNHSTIVAAVQRVARDLEQELTVPVAGEEICSLRYIIDGLTNTLQRPARVGR